MQFEWDESKSEENNRKRGIPFGYAALAFDGPVIEREDLRFPYGERRIIATGMVERYRLTVVFTDRATDETVVRRIIAAWSSSRRDRRRYDQAYPTHT